MPIYEFHCKECSREFSSLRRTGQINDVACPSCGATRVNRLLSVTARVSSDAAQQAPCGDPGACCSPAGPASCMRPGGCGCIS